MTATRDIHWLAGLLEGEGSFGLNRNLKRLMVVPRISYSATDKDVVERAAKLTCCKVFGPYKRTNCTPIYRVDICYNKAIQWMMTLHSLFGLRRRKQVEKVLTFWKSIRSNSARVVYGWETRRRNQCKAG